MRGTMNKFLIIGLLTLMLGVGGWCCLLGTPLEERFPVGVIFTVVLLLLFVALSMLFYTSISDTRARAHILAALRSKTQDEDSHVRSEAVKELANLDLVRATHHYKHDELDSLLIEKLEDESPDVRAEAVEGIGKVEAELEHPSQTFFSE